MKIVIISTEPEIGRFGATLQSLAVQLQINASVKILAGGNDALPKIANADIVVIDQKLDLRHNGMYTREAIVTNDKCVMTLVDDPKQKGFIASDRIRFVGRTEGNLGLLTEILRDFREQVENQRQPDEEPQPVHFAFAS